MHKKLRPSLAWRRDIFESPPRRDILAISKTTTKVPVKVPLQGREEVAEGNNEATALLSLKYLQVAGLVSRFKSQAFDLGEIGGPQGHVPDVIAETSDTSLHVIQVKAKRFLSEEVQSRFDTERAFLEHRHFSFHVWTDHDVLSNPLYQNVRIWNRAMRSPAPPEVLARIAEFASKTNALVEVLDQFGWDDAMSAWANCAFHIDLRKKINDNTTISQFLPNYNSYFFPQNRAGSGRWWDQLVS